MSWDGLGMIMQGEERVVLKNTHKVLFPQGNGKNTRKVLFPLGNSKKTLGKSVVPFWEQQLFPVGNNSFSL